MNSHTNRNRKPKLSLAPRSHTNLLLASGIVLAAVVGLILVVFVVGPLVSAGCDLVAEFWMRVREAVGRV